MNKIQEHFLKIYVIQCISDNGMVVYKKVFLKISQISQENTCGGVSYWIKLQDPWPTALSLHRLKNTDSLY